MTDSQDRRSAVRRIAAGVGAAALAAQARPGAAGAGPQSSKDSGRPVEIFRGTMPSPVYIPIGEEGTDRCVIVADGCAGRMRDCRHGDSRHMGSDRLFRYLQRKSGGEFSGLQTFRLEGINWRLQGLEEDPETGQWRIEATVCDSNPDARPNAQPAAGAAGEVDAAVYFLKGCNCTCDDKSYMCGTFDRYHARCGSSYASACGG